MRKLAVELQHRLRKLIVLETLRQQWGGEERRGDREGALLYFQRICENYVQTLEGAGDC